MARALLRVADLDPLRRQLRVLNRQLPSKILPAAMKAMVQEVAVPEAREQAPKRSGTLARTVRGRGQQKGAFISAGFKRVPYAGPIHYGWPSRNIEANPFLERAARMVNQGRALRSLQTHMATQMHRVASIQVD